MSKRASSYEQLVKICRLRGELPPPLPIIKTQVRGIAKGAGQKPKRER